MLEGDCIRHSELLASAVASSAAASYTSVITWEPEARRGEAKRGAASPGAGQGFMDEDICNRLDLVPLPPNTGFMCNLMYFTIRFTGPPDIPGLNPFHRDAR